MAQSSAQAVAISPEGPVTGSAGDGPRWRQVSGLPCKVSIEVLLRGFTLKDLLGLRADFVVRSQRPAASDLPLLVNGVCVAACELEALGSRLSARVTEIV